MSGKAFAVDAREGRVSLGGGRQMAWREVGDPAGLPVLALHGTPGSRLKFDVADQAARQLGLRIVSPDRWGYGETSPHPAPSLRAFAEDVRDLMDALALPRATLLGVSGGGPFAAALASLFPARIGAMALVAPVGPIAGEDVRMSAFHGFCFRRLALQPAATRLVFRAFRRMLQANPRLGMGVVMARAPAADRRVLASDGVRERLGRTFLEGLRHGPEGPAIDMAIFGAPWGIPLALGNVPASMWVGLDDRNVPLAAARLLAARLPRCRTVELPGAGHLWVSLNYDKVLAWLAHTELASQRSAGSQRVG